MKGKGRITTYWLEGEKRGLDDSSAGIPNEGRNIQTENLTGRVPTVSYGSRLRQIDALRPFRRDCNRLRHRRMSRVVSKGRAAIFL